MRACALRRADRLAARDAIATLQADAWRPLYCQLDANGDGVLERDEVVDGLTSRGASAEQIADILAALFARGGRDVGVDNFVRRAQRLQNPLQLDLMGSGATCD